MELKAHESLLFMAILERLLDQVPEIRYIEQDLGQLENYEMRPAVSWPCTLIDIDDLDFSETGGKLVQLAQGFVQIRLGLVKYTDSNNLVPANIRANSLQYLELENKVYKALHGWGPEGFNKMLRRKSVTEKRDDDIRVKILRFSIGYKDEGAVPARLKVSRPGVTIGTGLTS